jgi:hypothetical protein
MVSGPLRCKCNLRSGVPVDALSPLKFRLFQLIQGGARLRYAALAASGRSKPRTKIPHASWGAAGGRWFTVRASISVSPYDLVVG